MPEITLSIPCEAYLSQWFLNDSGGAQPIRLRKFSPEHHLLRVLLVNKNLSNLSRNPAIVGQTECAHNPKLEIIIPSFKGMPPEIYNHITPRGEKVFTDLLRKRFDLELFQDMIPVLQYAPRRDELIWAWMESHNIEPTETNYLAIDKRLQRMLNRLRTRQRVADYRRRKRSQK
ncbi:MAG: hypothetical protein HDS36_00855 [Bacteroides sp.]|nr:hypothetical protein [Bacteroides sp.]